MNSHYKFDSESGPESGNVIFFILLAVALIGLVTAALRSGGEGANIDRETVLIRASEVRQYASELERGVAFIMREGHSETDILFSHPLAHADYGVITNSPQTQVFDEVGGGATYRLPPSGITTDNWEFYGNTHAIDVGANNPGDERPDLMAVLPNVTKAFCDKINDMNGQTAVPKEIGGGCPLHDTTLRFTSGAGNQYQDGAVNVLDNAVTSFSVRPAMQACVECPGPAYHFYHVLLAR